MRVIFFSKFSKFNLNFKNEENRSEKVFCSLDIAPEVIALKMSLTRRNYLKSAVNVLTNRPKIFHVNKTDFLQLNCFHSHQ